MSTAVQYRTTIASSIYRGFGRNSKLVLPKALEGVACDQVKDMYT